MNKFQSPIQTLRFEFMQLEAFIALYGEGMKRQKEVKKAKRELEEHQQAIEVLEREGK